MFHPVIQNYPVDKNGLRMIHNAIKNNHTAIIDKLIENKCDVNIKDRNDDTPLHLAISSNNTELANKILDLGADVNIANK